MELNLPKLPKLTLSKLQALLLLGGAFVFASCLFVACRYRLALDTTPQAPPGTVAVLSVLRRDEAFRNSQPWKKFLAALPKEAGFALSQAVPGQAATLFAVRGQEENLQWGLVEALSIGTQGRRPVWRLVARHTDAVGFIEIEGRRQPFTMHLGLKNAELKVGRAYRGILPGAPEFSAGRRLISPIKEQTVHLEKPANVSWNGIPSFFQGRLQRFNALAEPWNWPGHVEVNVSASATGESLLPFVLYYKPQAGDVLIHEKIDAFAKNLLADALPQAIKVSMPDDSSMLELRHDPESVQHTDVKNRFGRLLKFMIPAKSLQIAVFHADTGESWVSTDVGLIQAGLLDSLGMEKPSEACDRGGEVGFASFAGPLMSEYGQLKTINLSLHNLETGLFTICGYYP